MDVAIGPPVQINLESYRLRHSICPLFTESGSQALRSAGSTTHQRQCLGDWHAAQLPTLMSLMTLWKPMGRSLGSRTIRGSTRGWFPTSAFCKSSALPMTTRSTTPCSKPGVQPPLYTQHETFTHGGNFWRDNYLLERWAKSEQPVVYLGDVYNNYELRLRLGDWCWLAQDPVSGYADVC
jgi:hypothetical protein